MVGGVLDPETRMHGGPVNAIKKNEIQMEKNKNNNTEGDRKESVYAYNHEKIVDHTIKENVGP